MPFESLSERLQMSLRRLTGRGKVNENDIDEIMKEVRVALLEADVNYKIVKSFIADVKEKALGEEVAKSLKPGELFVKIVIHLGGFCFSNHLGYPHPPTPPTQYRHR